MKTIWNVVLAVESPQLYLLQFVPYKLLIGSVCKICLKDGSGLNNSDVLVSNVVVSQFDRVQDCRHPVICCDDYIDLLSVTLIIYYQMVQLQLTVDYVR